MSKISSNVLRYALLCLTALFIGTSLKTQPLAAPASPPGKIATTLKENTDILQITISLRPFTTQQKDPGGSLRSLLLYSSNLRLEPHAIWPDGTPVSADAKLTKQQMTTIVNELDRLQVFKNAGIFYSVHRQGTKAKPPAGADIKRYYDSVSENPSCVIRANYINGDYHSYVISTIPYGAETIKLLNALKPHVPGTSIDELIATCNRFPVDNKKPAKQSGRKSHSR